MVFLGIARSEARSFKKSSLGRSKSGRGPCEIDRPSSEPGFHFNNFCERHNRPSNLHLPEVRSSARESKIETALNGSHPQSPPTSAGSGPPLKASKVLGVNDFLLNDIPAEQQRTRLSRRNPSRQSNKICSCVPINADEGSRPQKSEYGDASYDGHEAAGDFKHNARLSPNISQPSNFQHLTHTQPHQFVRMVSTTHNDLVTEFSVHRASQASRRDLRGIKVGDLSSRSSSVDTAAVPSLASESSHDSLHSSCHHSPSSSQSSKAPRTKGSFSLPFTGGQVPKIPVNEEHQQRQQQQSTWKAAPTSHHSHENTAHTKDNENIPPQERQEGGSWQASQSECAVPEPLSFSATPSSHSKDWPACAAPGPPSSVSASGTSATAVGVSSPESKESIRPSLQLQHPQQEHSRPQQPKEPQQGGQQNHKSNPADLFPLPVVSPPAIAIDDVDLCEDAYHEYLRSMNQSCTLEAPECSLRSPAMTASLHGLETILPSVSEDDEGFATFSSSVRMVDLPVYDAPDCTEPMDCQNWGPSYRPESQQSTSTVTLSNARESLINQPPPKALGRHSSASRFDLAEEHRVSMNRSSMIGGLFSSWAADSDSSSDEEFDATIESARNLSTLREEDEESIPDSQNTIPEAQLPSRPTTPYKTSPPALTLETHLLDGSTSSLEEVPDRRRDSSNDAYQQVQTNQGSTMAQQSVHGPESAMRRHLPGSSSLASASECPSMSPRSAMRDPQNTSRPRPRANTAGKSVRFEDTQSRSRSRSRSRSNQRHSPDIADYSKIRANLEELQKSLAKLEMQASEPPSKDEISTVSEVLRVTKDLERSKSTQKLGHQRNNTISEPVSQDFAKQAPVAANAGKVRVPSPARNRSRTLATVSDFSPEPIVEEATTTAKPTSPPTVPNQKRPRDTPSPATSARFSVFPPLAAKKPPVYPNT